MTLPQVTPLRRLRRSQPVRSLTDLRHRISALEQPKQPRMWQKYIALANTPLAMRNHVWHSDFDNLDLAVQRAEAGNV